MRLMSGHGIVMIVIAILALSGLFFLVSYLRRAVTGDTDATLRTNTLNRIQTAGIATLDPEHGGDEKEPKEVDAYIVIPDIGGYTRFLQLNHLSLGHAQYVISALLQSILDVVQDRLQVAKIQGDALLLYRVTEDNDRPGRSAEEPGAGIAAILEAFYKKRIELEHNNACPCGACHRIGELELKVIVHLGRILRYRLRGSEELSGVPLIVAYRLLKNSVGLDRYVFVTEGAHRGFKLPLAATAESHVEPTDVGDISGYVYSFELEDVMPSEAKPEQSDLAAKAVDMVRKIGENVRMIGGRSQQAGPE